MENTQQQLQEISIIASEAENHCQELEVKYVAIKKKPVLVILQMKTVRLSAYGGML